jgi:hypothetical protein
LIKTGKRGSNFTYFFTNYFGLNLYMMEFGGINMGRLYLSKQISESSRGPYVAIIHQGGLGRRQYFANVRVVDTSGADPIFLGGTEVAGRVEDPVVAAYNGISADAARAVHVALGLVNVGKIKLRDISALLIE